MLRGGSDSYAYASWLIHARINRCVVARLSASARARSIGARLRFLVPFNSTRRDNRMISESIETRGRTRFFSAFYFRPRRAQCETYAIAVIIASRGRSARRSRIYMRNQRGHRFRNARDHREITFNERPWKSCSISWESVTQDHACPTRAHIGPRSPPLLMRQKKARGAMLKFSCDICSLACR